MGEEESKLMVKNCFICLYGDGVAHQQKQLIHSQFTEDTPGTLPAKFRAVGCHNHLRKVCTLYALQQTGLGLASFVLSFAYQTMPLST